MLTKRIIPCLDVDGGRIVKGIQFQNLRDAGDPVQRAAEYERQGADELVILDVSATQEARRTCLETIAAVREHISLPLTVGGGVRSLDDAAALLQAGADKVAVNTAAVNDPTILARLADAFGRQCVVLAMDAASNGDGWEIVTHSGRTRTGKDAVAWAVEATRLGAGEILLTSWDRDGTAEGYDVPLIAAVAGAVEVPIIASGGAAGPQCMADALAAGADAVLAASIFHDGQYCVGDLKAFLAKNGANIRP